MHEWEKSLRIKLLPRLSRRLCPILILLFDIFLAAPMYAENDWKCPDRPLRITLAIGSRDAGSAPCLPAEIELNFRTLTGRADFFLAPNSLVLVPSNGDEIRARIQFTPLPDAVDTPCWRGKLSICPDGKPNKNGHYVYDLYFAPAGSALAPCVKDACPVQFKQNEVRAQNYHAVFDFSGKLTKAGWRNQNGLYEDFMKEIAWSLEFPERKEKFESSSCRPYSISEPESGSAFSWMILNYRDIATKGDLLTQEYRFFERAFEVRTVYRPVGIPKVNLSIKAELNYLAHLNYAGKESTVIVQEGTARSVIIGGDGQRTIMLNGIQELRTPFFSLAWSPIVAQNGISSFRDVGVHWKPHFLSFSNTLDGKANDSIPLEVSAVFVPRPPIASDAQSVIHELRNSYEFRLGGLDILSIPLCDSDGDGLSDRDELMAGSNPRAQDTDLDGQNDTHDSKPLLTEGIANEDTLKDSDGDGLTDAEEDKLCTSPYRIDTDGDGIPDKIDSEPLIPKGAKDLANAEIKNVGGEPGILVDGESIASNAFCQYTEVPGDLAGKLGKSDIQVFHVLASSGEPIFEDANFQRLDYRAKQIMENNPNAYLLIHYNFSPTEYFAERFPEGLTMFKDGGVLFDNKWYGSLKRYSFASREWHRTASENILDCINHLRKSPYANRVIGFQIGGGATGEWWWWSDYDHSRGIDYGSAMLKHFRSSLMFIYGGNISQLRRAWRQPFADFATAMPAPEKLRWLYALDNTMDLRDNKWAYDTWYAMNSCLPIAFARIASTIKKATKGRTLVGFYYDHGPQAYPMNGRSAVRDVFNNPNIDMLGAPSAYGDRGMGRSPLHRCALASLRLHNKIWMNEDDNRTHLVANWKPDCKDEHESVEMIKRTYGEHAIDGEFGYWCQFSRNWYDTPVMLEAIKKGQWIGRFDSKIDRTPGDRVAFVFSQEGIFSSNPYPGDAAHPNPDWRFSGVACEGIELEDFLDNPSRYKMAVFSRSAALNTDQRRRIKEKAEKDGRLLVYLYDSGYASPDMDANSALFSVSDLTGMKLRFAKKAGTLKMAPQASEFLPGIRQDAITGKQEGSLVADDPQMIPLAINEWEEVVIAAKVFPSHTTLYVNQRRLSASMLGLLAQKAGIHRFIDTPDVLFARGNLVMVHASSDGRKTLRLPHPSDVVELYDRKILGRGLQSFDIDMKTGDTRLYYYGTLSEYEKAALEADAAQSKFIESVQKVNGNKKSKIPLNPAISYSLTNAGFLHDMLILSPFYHAGARDAGEKIVKVNYFGCNPEIYKPKIGLSCVSEGMEATWEATHFASPKIYDTDLGVTKDQIQTFCFAAYLETKNPRNIMVRWGNDDISIFWWNGKQIGDLWKGSLNFDQHCMPVTLKKGRNLMLFKVCNTGGPGGLVIRFTEMDGKPVDDIKVWLSPE